MLKIAVKQKLGNFTLDVNTQLPAQGITAIFGLSGAGKTSLINIISGLSKPDNGLISLNNKVLLNTERSIFIPAHKRRIGYVFQDARLFPHYSVQGNLCYGMAKLAQKSFDSVVALLGIEHLLKRHPLMLSGGEKQRVAIGRALLTQPDLLLMDEPLAALDLPRKKELLPYLERLSQEINIPILYVSHSVDELIQLASHLLWLEQGKVVACDKLEKVWQNDTFLPRLTEKEPSTLLNMQLIRHHSDYAMSELKCDNISLWLNYIDKPIGQRLRIQIYANDVSLVLQPSEFTSIRNVLPAVIDTIIPQKNSTLVDIKLKAGEQILWSRITSWSCDELKLILGQTVFAQIKSVSLNK